jgi:hypothetical protein
MNWLLPCLGLWLAPQAPFAFREVAPGALQLSERGRPVFVYHYGMTLKPGAPEDRRRSSYLHPVWTPGGTVVTDDFPADHYHHRGVFWAWPRVKVSGQWLDLWSLHGIQERFLRWRARGISGSAARLEIEDGWFAFERQVLTALIEILAHPAEGPRRDLDFTLTLEALEPIELAGEPAQRKGYGGFSIRFAPRRDTLIRTDAGLEKADSNMAPHPWAELEADFAGARAAARIEIDPANPGYPNGWCLRHYGFLGVNFPGLESYSLQPGRPLRLRYRLTVFDR